MKRIFVFLMIMVFSMVLFSAHEAKAEMTVRERIEINTEITHFIGTMVNKDYTGTVRMTDLIDVKLLGDCLEYAEKKGEFNWNMDNLEDAYDIAELLTAWKNLFAIAVNNAIADGADYRIIFRLQQAKYNFTNYEREWARVLQ